MKMSQPMKSVQFGKWANQKILLCGVCYRSYHAKQTPEFHWITTMGYIRVVGPSLVQEQTSPCRLKFCHSPLSW